MSYESWEEVEHEKETTHLTYHKGFEHLHLASCQFCNPELPPHPLRAYPYEHVKSHIGFHGQRYSFAPGTLGPHPECWVCVKVHKLMIKYDQKKLKLSDILKIMQTGVHSENCDCDLCFDGA